jgi:UDP-N-acetylmuramate dehydrogenase
MNILRDVSLKPFNTFGIEVACRAMVKLTDRLQLKEIMSLPEYRSGPVEMLGGGSNVLFTDDYPGLIIINELAGRQVLDATDKHGYLRFFAGENWHRCVRWSLQNGYAGIENLSLIPGSAGAAPIQNIGAYGVELATVLDCVEVWDRQAQELRMLRNTDCRFAYRDSLFKHQPERFWVTSITLKLSRSQRLKLNYPGLKQQLQKLGIDHPTPQQVSDAVISIRTEKLPDPAAIGNAGSFFKNPVVAASLAESLTRQNPELPVYEQHDGGKKISAAWMIEQCGWKGFRDGDAGVSDQHALVIVNHGNASGADLWKLSNKVKASVQDQFGIALTVEPQIIGPQ